MVGEPRGLCCGDRVELTGRVLRLAASGSGPAGSCRFGFSGLSGGPGARPGARPREAAWGPGAKSAAPLRVRTWGAPAGQESAQGPWDRLPRRMTVALKGATRGPWSLPDRTAQLWTQWPCCFAKSQRRTLSASTCGRSECDTRTLAPGAHSHQSPLHGGGLSDLNPRGGAKVHRLPPWVVPLLCPVVTQLRLAIGLGVAGGAGPVCPGLGRPGHLWCHCLGFAGHRCGLVFLHLRGLQVARCCKWLQCRRGLNCERSSEFGNGSRKGSLESSFPFLGSKRRTVAPNLTRTRDGPGGVPRSERAAFQGRILDSAPLTSVTGRTGGVWGRPTAHAPHFPQMQKLVKAAKEGTKDRLEKTKAAVKRGRSFIRTKSFVAQGPWPPPGPPAGWGLGGRGGTPQPPAARGAPGGSRCAVAF